MEFRRNIRLVLEYDGGGYHGWQMQPQLLTIQGVIEDRIRRITQKASRVIGAGRTDAGVHALQQVAHFHTPSRLPLQALQRGLNALLPPDIRVLAVDEVGRSFHARFSALGKRYEYRIWQAAVSSAFYGRYAWWIPSPLDLKAMEVAAGVLVGRHDFTSFGSADRQGSHGVREVSGCGWRRTGPMLIFWIEADAFLRYMIRAIVGTLVDIGMGKRRPEDMAEIMKARDRSRAGMTAPARGLFLMSVFYPPNWELDRTSACEVWTGNRPLEGSGVQR